uniref:Uncharacterized protein n=1 Tax=Cannabis sativa TaxID=3483 RepID=A0A803P4M0_CANSA
MYAENGDPIDRSSSMSCDFGLPRPIIMSLILSNDACTEGSNAVDVCLNGLPWLSWSPWLVKPCLSNCSWPVTPWLGSWPWSANPRLGNWLWSANTRLGNLWLVVHPWPPRMVCELTGG